jgi:four helix bundle protein
MKENKLVDLSKQFALEIIELCENLKNFAITSQLVRSGTSIDANIHEANLNR